MVKENITEQRDRFLAFAFAGADLLMEIGEGEQILYSYGAVKGLTGVDEKSLQGRLWTDLFLETDRTVIKALVHNASIGQRCGPIMVTIQDRQRKKTGNVLMTAIRMPGKDSIYITLSYPNTLMTRIAQEKRQETESSALLNKEEFSKNAQQAIKTAAEMGQEVDMTLFDMSNLESMKSRISQDQWNQMKDMMANLLKARSVDGQSATKISENQYGLLHDKAITAQNIQDQLSMLMKEIDPSGKGIEIEARSVEANVEQLSEREAARAFMYTLHEFEKKGADLNITNLDEGFKGFLNANAQKIQRFKNMVANLDFQLYFQPIVGLQNTKTSHYEILTRFRDGSSTYDWIVFGEEVGLAADFDLAVCERAIRYILHEPKTIKTKFAVNISGKSMQDEKFFAALQEKYKPHPELSERIMFEITESAAIQELDKVNEYIKTLHNDGFHVCLDDFGAGAASFQYLHKLHVDYVKLDGGYTENILHNKRDETMVRNLAQMCRDLSVKIVAERVETEEEARLLKKMGIDYGQGYFFSKPLPKPDFIMDSSKM